MEDTTIDNVRSFLCGGKMQTTTKYIKRLKYFIQKLTFNVLIIDEDKYKIPENAKRNYFRTISKRFEKLIANEPSEFVNQKTIEIFCNIDLKRCCTH